MRSSVKDLSSVDGLEVGPLVLPQIFWVHMDLMQKCHRGLEERGSDGHT